MNRWVIHGSLKEFDGSGSAITTLFIPGTLRRIVVLLKHGILEAVECQDDEVFLLARVRGAGICGVFDDHETAENYINKHRLPPDSQRSVSASPSR